MWCSYLCENQDFLFGAAKFHGLEKKKPYKYSVFHGNVFLTTPLLLTQIIHWQNSHHLLKECPNLNRASSSAHFLEQGILLFFNPDNREYLHLWVNSKRPWAGRPTNDHQMLSDMIKLNSIARNQSIKKYLHVLGLCTWIQFCSKEPKLCFLHF